MFKIRTEPVKYGEAPYKWGIDSVYQCTWFVYFRIAELGLGWEYPCWWDRATQTGSYTNAKDWLKNFRDPWQVKGTDYTPVAGDIAVFDGNYGHVQFMETDVMYSEYSNGDPNSFRNGKFEKKPNLLGFLHYPLASVPTVERNTSVNQIHCTDSSLRIRVKPSLSAEIVGHVSCVENRYYNVLNIKEADGYKWYKIANDRWCADIGIIYYPVAEDFVKQLEEFLNVTRAKINSLQSENEDMRNDMKQMKNIAERWL